jgi:hypothetical protein
MFLTYVQQMRVQTLRKRDIVVTDNFSSQKAGSGGQRGAVWAPSTVPDTFIEAS